MRLGKMRFEENCVLGINVIGKDRYWEKCFGEITFLGKTF